MDFVKAAVVGLGAHARRGHVDHFAKAGIRLVHACDLYVDALSGFAAAYEDALDFGSGADECHLSTRFEDVLANPEVEAVFLMTPDRFHVDQTLAALRAGKHVFCEKPMADSLPGLLTLGKALDLARERGLVLSSCHPRRYDRPFVWLKAQLPGLTAALGPVVEFRFDFFYHKLRKQGLHHGLLIDHLSHEVDLLTFLFGRQRFTAHKLFDEEARYNVAGLREDGIAFSFCGTRTLAAPIYPEYATVRFARGEVQLDAHTGEAVVIDRDAGTRRADVCGATDYDGRFTAVNRNFADAVRGRAASYLTGDDLLVNTESSVQLTLASPFYRSPCLSRPPEG